MNPTPIVYIVDDDEAARDSVAMLLELHGFRVAAFASARAFLEKAGPEDAGCVLIDLRMPGMDGLALQGEMRRRGLGLPTIFLSAHGDIPSSVMAIKGGAANFLTKPAEPAALLDAIRAAMLESDALRARSLVGKSATARLATLTGREREVMALVIQGLSNKEIGRVLGISHRTVDIHRANLMHKAGAHNLLDLIRVAGAAGAGLPDSPAAGGSA
jgi:FixJ family two-component response regulator